MSIEDIKKKLGELYLNAEECKKDNLYPEPSTELAKQWYNKTIEYIGKGLDTEGAGKKAAQELFGKYFKDNTQDFIALSQGGFIESKGREVKSFTLMTVQGILDSLKDEFNNQR